MSARVVMAAAGARTPLGLGAEASAAAVRAGIGAAREHPFIVDRLGNYVNLAFDAELDPGLHGPSRLLALAGFAWRDLTRALAHLGEAPLRSPMMVALPEIRPGFTHEDASAVMQGLRRLGGSTIDPIQVSVHAQGHAGGVAAFRKASESLGSGELDACVVGGIDSYLHPETLNWLDGRRQIAGEGSRSGFVPGEGAAFCLLMSDAACRRLGVAETMHLVAAATGSERCLIKTREVCVGKGLTAVVRDALTSAPGARKTIDHVICDINGERYRGEEWGFVCLRLGRHFKDATGYLSPADVWGDVGAASGPLFAMLAHQAASRGYAAGPRTLIWSSSEAGLRACALFESATMPAASRH
ncbi:beta-ketoacyl synthase N-terminal-like domain-containing protein [Caballeronia sp. AZ7_KS35]|uniref:beta-ketoacyl synthase N-terminal-like domain-containing protein n=1 Tax=Caballeronia sp. AZ7_KS35 TaxID=2921762 RepID=UPI002028D732|nr:beta-ketoacyl synthase N-terminal-like domain-containing protein [Caballeronia sp. AZ7_KS35]